MLRSLYRASTGKSFAASLGSSEDCHREHGDGQTMGASCNTYKCRRPGSRKRARRAAICAGKE